MRHANPFIALAVIGLTACASPAKRRSPPEPSGPERCPKPEPAASTVAEARTFELGKPPLPEGVSCLRWPMPDFRKVSSEFRDPDHAFTPGKHAGTDMPAPVGTAVLAPAAGTVVRTLPVEPCRDAAVVVRFDEGWTYAAHHLSRVDVREGEKVVAGQRLGLSGGAVDAPGSGPWTTGPHLHFSLQRREAYVDAERYFCPQP